MKAFNKLFSLVVASVLVFSLAGCGDKEESKKFSANLNGTEIAITYVYKGDKVLKQSSETKIQFASIGATTKEDAAKTLEPLSANTKTSRVLKKINLYRYLRAGKRDYRYGKSGF